MSIRIINGKVYKNGAFSEEEIVLKEGKIVSAQDGDAEEVYDVVPCVAKKCPIFSNPC